MAFYLIANSVTLSANSSDSLTLECPKQKGINTRALLFSSTGTFKITKIVDAMGNDLITGDISSGTLADARNYPQVFEGLDIPPGGQLNFYLTDTSGSSNTVEIALIGEPVGAE